MSALTCGGTPRECYECDYVSCECCPEDGPRRCEDCGEWICADCITAHRCEEGDNRRRADAINDARERAEHDAYDNARDRAWDREIEARGGR